MPSLSVKEYYAGKSIFITGATGFMGKVLVEKLLRACPDIKKIYLLVRNKKGISPDVRLGEVTNSKLFDKLKEQNPEAISKLRLVSGDISEDNLGISIKDEEELQRECQIVFNNAACVRFDLTLRDAIKINTLGTLKVLKLSEKMKNLEVFMHVSTSFCHDELDVLEDKLYPPKHTYENIMNLLEWMDDKTLAVVQPELIKPYPNTYGYSKCLTEDVVAQYEAKFPIAIVRPSIVIPTWKDPIPGWIDNINGPTGVLYAGSRGVLHSMYCKDTAILDTVPVDCAINVFILVAHFTGLERPKDIRVCNVTAYEFQELTWVAVSNYWAKCINEYPLSYSLWYPVAEAHNYKWQHKICEFFFHILPAYFIDMILFLLGMKTFMVFAVKRLTHGLELLEYYNNRTWIFKNDHMRSLHKQISKEDNETFFTDLSSVDVGEFVMQYVKGMRAYYCKEDDSTLPKARKLIKRLYYLHVVVKYAFFALCVYLMYSIYAKIFTQF